MINKQILEKWCELLESGSYEQNRNSLKNGNAYCCIGVCANMLNIPIVETNGYDDEEDINGNTYVEFRELTGLKSEHQDSLVIMNDINRKNFKEIAKFIRENYLK